MASGEHVDGACFQVALTSCRLPKTVHLSISTIICKLIVPRQMIVSSLGKVQTILRISVCRPRRYFLIFTCSPCLDLITKVSKCLSKGDVVITNIHIGQHLQIVPVIPVNLGLVKDAIFPDHGLAEECPGIIRLIPSVGSLVSIILRLEVRPRLAVQKGADNTQLMAIIARPGIILQNRKPLANLHILILVLIIRKSCWLKGGSSSCRSNNLSGLCICVYSVHSSRSRV
jgi:hypothetical protein